MTMLPYPGGVFIGGFGPPLPYDTLTAQTGNKYGGNPDVTPFLQGAALPPLPEESGWKDTFIAMPGMVNRLVVRWAPTDKLLTDPAQHYPFEPAALGRTYVWHCHIVDHEDNDMMRPDRVTSATGANRTYVQGTDY
jgi:FtsP/CotA-like multicopper oxidase with cupredoxin domain